LSVDVYLGIRNGIIHWGAKHDGSDELLVTNANVAISKDRLREFRISPRDLRAMSLDLFLIGIHLLDAIRGGIDRKDPEWAQMLSATWLYKPPQQSVPKTTTNHPHKKGRTPPPQSSEK